MEGGCSLEGCSGCFLLIVIIVIIISIGLFLSATIGIILGTVFIIYGIIRIIRKLLS